MMDAKKHEQARKTLRMGTWFVASTAILIMVVSVVWNNVQENDRARTAQQQITIVAHQRDVALQEVHDLVTSNSENTARDAANISLLLNYITELNNRDALLFKYLHHLKVPIPVSLTKPIPAPHLLTAPGSKSSPKSTPSRTKNPRRGTQNRKAAGAIKPGCRPRHHVPKKCG